jgi:hypothetical protein
MKRMRRIIVSLSQSVPVRRSCKSLWTSFRRKPESTLFKLFWTPAFAGVTEFASSARASVFEPIFSAFVLCLTCLQPPALSAAALPRYEAPPRVKASFLLAPDMLSGPLFKVDGQVPTDGLMGHFTLRSELGTFVVPGRELLRIRIAELPAIQQLNGMSKSQVFVEALGRAAAKPVESAQEIITHPVETVKNLPAGISRLFDRIELGAKKITQSAAEPGKSDSQRTEETLSRVGSATITALGFEQGRRQLAKSLGVDPYTTNPVLAQKLTDIAWVVFSGRLTVNTLVTAFVPASIAISGTSITHDLVYDTPAADLIVMNQQKLLAMGASDSQAQALLNNRWYSLSVLTELVTELERLTGITGRLEVIALAATATNEEEARFFAASVHLLSRLNAGKRPLKKMIGKGTVIGVTASGEVVVPAPLDYVSWTERIGRFAQRPDVKAAKRSIWLTGKISEVAERGFIGLGWHLFEASSP